MEQERNILYSFRIFFQELRYLMPKPMSKKMPLANMTQWFVLMYLMHNLDKEITQKDIERSTKRSRATISGVLNTMEKNGMIFRTVSEYDRRKKIVKVCPVIQDQMHQLKRQFDEAETVLVQGISQEELSTFCGVMEKMIANIRKEKEYGETI